MKAVFAGIGIFLAVVGLIFGGWYAYWAIARASTSNRYDVNTHNQQYQAGLVAQERDLVQGYDAAQDPAQKSQIKQQFCSIYQSVNPPPSDLVSAASRLCFGE